MVLVNYTTRELTAKLVYYGPGLCGKTTNLQYIYDNLLPDDRRGKMVSLATETDRTLFFDFLPLDIGTIRGLKTKLQLYTVPGQVHYNATRKIVLKGADGIVFVADSQPHARQPNIDSFKNMKENLAEHGLDLASVPHVLQFNKRDLPDVMSIEQMVDDLNEYNVPFWEASAIEGIGVEDTLKGLSKLVLKSLAKRFQAKEGEVQEGSDTATPPPAATASPEATVQAPRPTTDEPAAPWPSAEPAAEPPGSAAPAAPPEPAAPPQAPAASADDSPFGAATPAASAASGPSTGGGDDLLSLEVGGESAAEVGADDEVLELGEDALLADEADDQAPLPGHEPSPAQQAADAGADAGADASASDDPFGGDAAPTTPATHAAPSGDSDLDLGDALEDMPAAVAPSTSTPEPTGTATASHDPFSSDDEAAPSAARPAGDSDDPFAFDDEPAAPAPADSDSDALLGEEGAAEEARTGSAAEALDGGFEAGDTVMSSEGLEGLPTEADLPGAHRPASSPEASPSEAEATDATSSGATAEKQAESATEVSVPLSLGRVTAGETVQRELSVPVEMTDASGSARTVTLRVNLTFRVED